MHPEDLKILWLCHECGEVFIFHSDIEDHQRMEGHKKIAKVTDVRFSAA
jgi:hypothetical protein